MTDLTSEKKEELFKGIKFPNLEVARMFFDEIEQRKQEALQKQTKKHFEKITLPYVKAKLQEQARQKREELKKAILFSWKDLCPHTKRDIIEIIDKVIK